MRGMGAALTSRQNPLYRSLVKIAGSASERRKRGLCLLEGGRLVEAAAASGSKVSTVILPEGDRGGREASRIVEMVRPAEIVVLSRSLFRGLSSLVTVPEVMALAVIPEPSGTPVSGDLLLVDGIQDPGNLGTLLRSAAAANVKEVVISPSGADPWSPKVLRAGMGAHFHLSLTARADLAAAAKEFEGEVVILEQGGEASIYDIDLSPPVAIAVGAEGTGVTPSLADEADVRAAIPMPGWGEPLNAAAAATVLLFEMVRQRRTGRSPGR